MAVRLLPLHEQVPGRLPGPARVWCWPRDIYTRAVLRPQATAAIACSIAASVAAVIAASRRRR
jgi:hypothetical protein